MRNVLFLLAGLLCLQACVRVEEPSQPWRKNTYITTRDRQGVRIHVRSDQDERFTIEFRDRRVTPPSWQPLPGAVEVRGNGEMMEFHDTSPDAPHRTYRVQTLVGVPAGQLRRTLR